MNVHLKHAVTSMLGRGLWDMPTCRAGAADSCLSKYPAQAAGRVARLAFRSSDASNGGLGACGQLRAGWKASSSVRAQRVNLRHASNRVQPKHAVSVQAPNLSMADLKRYRHCTLL